MKLQHYFALFMLATSLMWYQNDFAATIKNVMTADISSRNMLNIAVYTDKKFYKLNDKITIRVLLTNISEKPIYIFDDLALGESASLSLWAINAKSNRAVTQTRMFDALPPPPRSKDRFIKLESGYIYGVTYTFKFEELGILKGGKYKLVANYHSPIPSGYSFGLPTWTREMGEVAAIPVTITVDK